MTTYYVKHTGTKATSGAGNDWTGALSGVYPRIADVFSLNTVNAGDEIRVSDAHNNTSATGWSASGPTRENPVRVLCVQDGAPGTLSNYTVTSAAIESAGSGANYNINCNAFIHGLNFKGRVMNNCANIGRRIIANKCKFESIGYDFGSFMSWGPASLSGSHYPNLYFDCVFSMSGGSAGDRVGMIMYGANVELYGGSVSCTQNVAGEGFFFGSWRDGQNWGNFKAVGVDFSGVNFNSNSIVPGLNDLFSVELIGCKMPTIPSGLTVFNSPPVHLAQSHDSTTTDSSNYARRDNQSNGKLEIDTASYRTAGWTDGVRANPISYKLTVYGTRSTKQYSPMRVLLGAIWVAAGSKTVDLYVASNDTLDDGQVWIDVLFPNASDNSSKMDLATTRVLPLTTPSTLTTGGTWGGTSITNKYKISKSITLNKAGIILVYANFAPDNASDKTLWIDPAFDVT